MDQINELKELAALTALNTMFAKGWVDITAIKEAGALMDRSALGGDAFRVLSALHCVHFDKMPEQLRESLPELIRECLGAEVVFRFQTLQQRVIDVQPAPVKRSGFLRLLGGAR